MPGTHLNKNGYFFVFLISLVLIILWNSRTDLPPKKAGLDGKGKKEGMDMGGLGGGQPAAPAEAPQTPAQDATPPEPPQLLQPPVPPPRPAWLDDPSKWEEPPPAPAAPPSPQEPPHPKPTNPVGRPNPNFDIDKLKQYKPHNYWGPGYPTYATYLSTRQGTVRDPYFLAAQQLVYRVLWDPRSKSLNHPITVFVAPHISTQQRDILLAAGANVRELDFVEGHVAESDETKWKDLFSKINMWGQTDFSRITFLDIDAFPIKNIDGIFEVAQKRQCQREFLAPEEQASAHQICEFVFTGTDMTGAKEVNAGVMVFEPNAAMHQYLLRESKKTENFDSSMAEQPFLNYAFRQNGPFPTEFVDRIWNGVRPQQHELATLKVMHAKLWEVDSEANGALSWAGDMFDQNWLDMLDLYQSREFESMRAADGTHASKR